MKTNEWQRPRPRTARKPHTCDWCLTAIPRGETYTYWFGLAEESYETAQTRAHNDCWAAMDREAAECGWEDICWYAPHKRVLSASKGGRRRMSIADEQLSFRYLRVHRYRLEDDHGGRRTWRNGLGWEIRHVTPTGASRGGGFGRLRRMWRYDVHDPQGQFVASEPTFWEASRAFSAAYCRGGGES